MKSLMNGSNFIEKSVAQEAGDADWLEFTSTTVSYKPEDIKVKKESTKDTLVFNNKNVSDKEVVLELANVSREGRDLTNITPVTSITASDAEVDDFFGMSLDITSDGLVAIIGAFKEGTTGKVYTYKRATIDDDWVEVSQLTASDAETDDHFGVSVAITSDGLSAMVGAQKEDTAASNAGKVYTYKRATVDDAWTEVSQLTASDAADNDFFGASLVITPDSLVAMVGAQGEDTAGTDAGKVYTYKRATVDDAWTEVNQLTASDAADSDHFGRSVAITEDGLVATVGAYSEDTAGTKAGKVYTYKRATIDDAWTEVSQLTASDASDNYKFGHGCSISSDGLTALVGTWGPSKVYVYKRASINDPWTEVNIIHGSYNLGNDTAIASDAGVILIGASLYNNGMGTVYEYKIQDSYIIDDTTTEMISYQVDDSKIIEGSKDKAMVEVIGDIRPLDREPNIRFGRSVAVTPNGLVAMVGAAGFNIFRGKVYTYKRATIYDAWIEVSQLNISSSNTYDQFGQSMAISSDGLVAIIGSHYEDTAANNAGKVYTYKRGTIDDAWTEVSQLTASDAEDNDMFGISVAMSSDGLVSMVGAYGKDTDAGNNAGKVYTYKRATIGDAWTEVSQLTASDALEGDQFGVGIGMSANGLMAMVGAWGSDVVANNAGKVYTYKRATIDDPWTEVSQLTASDGEDTDFFGKAAYIYPDGLTSIIGSRNKNTVHGTNTGEAYVYKRSTIDDPWIRVATILPDDLEPNDAFSVSLTVASDVDIIFVGTHGRDKHSGMVYECSYAKQYSLDITDANIIKTPIYGYIRSDVNVAIDVDIDETKLLNLPAKYVKVVNKDITNKTLTLNKSFSVPSKVIVGEDEIVVTSIIDNGDDTYTIDASAVSSLDVNFVYVKEGLNLPIKSSTTTSISTDKTATVISKNDTVYIDGNEVIVNDVTYGEVSLGIQKPKELVSADAVDGDYYGYAISVTPNGLIAMVGSFYNDAAGTDDGKVYTYKRASIDDEWIEVTQLVGNDGERLGSSIAMTPNGLVAIVGATAASNGDMVHAGKVYTYKRATIDDAWTEVSQLTASDAEASIYYGFSVTISSDGLVAMAGAHYKNTDKGDYSGQVYTYKRATIDDAWTEVSIFTASDAKRLSRLGLTIGMTSDGLNFVTSETTNNTGVIVTGTRSTIDDPWTELNILPNPHDDTIGFGGGLTLSRDGLTLIAVSGNDVRHYAIVDTFKRSSITDTWTLDYSFKVYGVNNVNHSYLMPCLIEDRLFLGNPAYYGTGVVFETTRDANDSSKWHWPIELMSKDIAEGDQFGISVALNGDGLVAMVGAGNQDTAGGDAGKVYTYKRATVDDPWTEVNQLTASDPEAGDHFGYSVAMSSDGLVSIIGAHRKDNDAGTDAGKVYTYKRATIDDSWVEVSQLTASDATAGDIFGVTVAINENGLIAMVGAVNQDTAATNAGKVYTYKRATIDDPWTEVNQLTASDAEDSGRFGRSVTMTPDGLVAMVGAYYADTYEAKDAGKVYTYKRATIDDAWTEVSQLTASDATEHYLFGLSVAITGDGLVSVVGTVGNKAYVYKRDDIDKAWDLVEVISGKGVEYGDILAISKNGEVLMLADAHSKNLFNDSGKVYTYKTNINKEVTLTIPEQASAPSEASIVDKSTSLALDSSSYSNGIITNKYKGHSERSRAIKRAIFIEEPNVEILAPFTTTVNKVK